MYGCLAWFIPGLGYVSRGSSMISTIRRVQRRAAQIITGVFRTIAGTAVDIEAHLLPVIQQLQQTAIETTMRIRTTPLFEEMAIIENSQAQQYPRKDVISPINRFSTILKDKFDMDLSHLKKRQPHIVSPWWKPPKTRVAKSAAEAIEEHNKVEPGTIRIYTNGSGINGHIGTAAMAPNLQVDGLATIRIQYMGDSDVSIVYAVEL